MEAITIVLIVILLIMIYIVRRKQGIDVGVRLPPGCMGWPIIGQTINFAIKKVAFFTEKHEQYGSVFKTSLFGKKIVRVYGAENIRKIIQGENKIVQSSYPASVKKLVGDQSISMSLGETHKDRKRHLMKYLSPDFFHNHTPILSRAISDRLQTWSTKPDIDLYHECRSLFIELAARFLINIDISDDAVSELIDQLEIFTNNIFCFPANIPGFGFHKALKAKQRMREIIASALCESMNNNEASEEFCSVLQGLNGCSGDIDVEKNVVLLDSIIDLLFSGSAPVSSAGFSIAHQLTKRSDIRDKLRAEVNLHDLSNADEPVCATDIQDMTYVDAVVKETLRMLPPVGGAYRKVLESFELDGYTVPKGWSVVFGIRETHNRDPSISDTASFNPDRWVQADPLIKGKYSFLPFGGGARVCPGQAYAKMVLKLFTVEFSRLCAPELIQDSDISLWPTPRPAHTVTVAMGRL